ncbi:MAG: phosphatidylglycerophosphate synthase [Bradymonadia bacterium]|jgi:phosphatidylglycerophosphate synthase
MRRPADYPLTIALINPINRRLVRSLHKAKVSPNLVTWVSFILAIAASYSMFAHLTASAVWTAPAVLLLTFISHQLDALDGDLARYSGCSSRYGAVLDPTLDRVREVLFIGAVALASPERETVLWALAAIAGAQVYYYTVDVSIRRLLEVGVHDLKKHVVTAGDIGGTTVKFGLYEPFLYGIALAVVSGFAAEALVFFTGAFWLAWIGQMVKMYRASRP